MFYVCFYQYIYIIRAKCVENVQKMCKKIKKMELALHSIDYKEV